MLKIFLLLGIGAVVAFGIIAYNSTQNSESGSNNTNDGSSPPLATSEQESRYKIFTDDVLSKASDSRRILFFYASWCPTCRPIDAEFNNKAGKIPEDVTIIRVNYNDPDTDETEKKLAKDYGITYQHTFVQIDTEGNEITKWNGGGLDNLFANLR